MRLPDRRTLLVEHRWRRDFDGVALAIVDDRPADGADVSLGRMPEMPLDAPASALNTTISARPAIRVRLAPIRLDTQPVTSIATAVMTR